MLNTTNNKGAPSHGTLHKPPSLRLMSGLENTRVRLMLALRISPITTIQARRDLDILIPATRVHELRHGYGYLIDLVWTKEQTECGRWHKVGRYIFSRMRCSMDSQDWQESLQILCNRFAHLDIGADLAALSVIEAWGVYRFLSRLADA